MANKIVLAVGVQWIRLCCNGIKYTYIIIANHDA